jgi:hypothetical protein
MSTKQSKPKTTTGSEGGKTPPKTKPRGKARDPQPTHETVRQAITELRERTVIMEALVEKVVEKATSGVEDGEGFYKLLIAARDAVRVVRQQVKALDDATAGRAAKEVH